MSSSVRRARSSEEVQIGCVDATEASGGQAGPAARNQGGGNLESDNAGSVHHVEPAIAQSDPFDKGELIVTLHVTEQANAFMAFSTIQLKQKLIVVVADITCVWQAPPTLLPIAARQPMGSFHIMQKSHLQRRFGPYRHVTQNAADQLPILVAATLVHRS